MKNKKYYLLTILAVIFLAIAAIFISAKSQPESFLYPVRLSVFEKLIALTKKDDYEKAVYALNLSENRLQELENLKEKNLLDTKSGKLTRDDFNSQTVLAQSIILDLSAKEGINSQKVLELSEILFVQIERAKEIFNIDQLEKLPEDAPLPKDFYKKKKI